jgi:hypothetical protein
LRLDLFVRFRLGYHGDTDSDSSDWIRLLRMERGGMHRHWLMHDRIDVSLHGDGQLYSPDGHDVYLDCFQDRDRAWDRHQQRWWNQLWLDVLHIGSGKFDRYADCQRRSGFDLYGLEWGRLLWDRYLYGYGYGRNHDYGCL